jgi:hypothetical protein
MGLFSTEVFVFVFDTHTIRLETQVLRQERRRNVIQHDVP